MIHPFDDVRAGFDVDADVVVVGSGAGGAVAAANLARAGLRTVVLEAGPELRPEDMTRDAPLFMARYYWEGGLRMLSGTTQIPTLQARCVGGSTVVNSAILMELPGWVREAWQRETGLSLFTGPLLDAAYRRVFSRSRAAPTPMTVMGRRNLVVRDALARAGMNGGPLPRAVVDCEGSADCFTGCAGGRKQSVDRTFLRDAVRDGASVYTCAHVESVELDGHTATGVVGTIRDPNGQGVVARFRVRARRVVLAAGVLHTPVILQRSGITAGGAVGGTLFSHIGGGMVGILPEVVDPWVGATQGWGALSDEIRGMKYECLWAPPSVLMVRWGDVGHGFLRRLGEVKHATVIATVYRARVHGRVRARRNGMPSMSLYIPDDEARTVFRGLKIGADALLDVGAEYVHTGVPGVVDEMRSRKDTESLLSPNLGAKNLQMSATHVFGSCRMSEREGAVDETGRVLGTRGVYVADASLFPSPSSVNPQATIMALSDLVSRGLGELSPTEPPGAVPLG
ncbi:MAG TPA: GMC family oxidoreductase N-terminal domain-containing protein [Polyangiaceae bacterium]|nr:GMC family oxidoreductase N-terminal domain-containing protein [Polyangiaceae bacterium]